MTDIARYIPVLIVPASLLVAFIAFLLLKIVRAKWLGGRGFVKKTFLTGNEVEFYHRLSKALGPDWILFPQVCMGALMNTTLKATHPGYWDERQRFAAKICDFVVCDRKTLKPRLIIELDDVMHDFQKDRLRDTVTALAGYRTVRFWSRNKPSLEELKVLLDKELALEKL